MKSSMRYARFALCVLFFGVLSACGGLGDLGPDTEVSAIYRLVPVDLPTGSGSEGTLLIVDEPTLPRSYGGYDIAVSRAAGRVEVYPGVKWGDTARKQLERFIAAKLSASGEFRAVSVGVYSDTKTPRLKIDMSDFSYHPDNGGQVVVSGTATLLGGSGREILGHVNLRSTAPVASDGADDVVQALRDAADTFSEDLIAWVADTLG